MTDPNEAPKKERGISAGAAIMGGILVLAFCGGGCFALWILAMVG